eukprot:1152746-Pelagomonas_calceolata.AAC.1
MLQEKKAQSEGKLARSIAICAESSKALKEPSVGDVCESLKSTMCVSARQGRLTSLQCTQEGSKQTETPQRLHN